VLTVVWHGMKAHPVILLPGFINYTNLYNIATHLALYLAIDMATTSLCIRLSLPHFLS